MPGSKQVIKGGPEGNMGVQENQIIDTHQKKGEEKKIILDKFRSMSISGFGHSWRSRECNLYKKEVHFFNLPPLPNSYLSNEGLSRFHASRGQHSAIRSHSMKETNAVFHLIL